MSRAGPRLCPHGFLVSLGSSCPLCNPPPTTNRGANLGRPWTRREDLELTRLLEQGLGYPDIAQALERTPPAVVERARRLSGRRPD